MKKLFLCAALLLSMNSFADTDLNNLGSAIQQKLAASNSLSPSAAFIYSGKDISRPSIAAANKPATLVESSVVG